MPDGHDAGQTILVVGGGISGITTAVEAAETGYNVLLVEKDPHLGGRVAQHNKYFPKLCSPACGLEINFQRIKNNPRIRYLTLAEVVDIQGSEGAYTVRIRKHPRFVTEACTGCGECSKVCTAEVPDSFNFGMNKVKAIRNNHAMAFPVWYYMDPEFAKTAEASTVAKSCPTGAIQLGMQSVDVEEKVAAVVWATGWKPYDAEKITPYGFGQYANVTTNMRFERMANVFGPTGGKIMRPSDGKEAKNVAMIQCAGSRDHNHLAFCSRICCLASMKQAAYVRDQYPDSKVTIFYIDLRAMDRYEAFLQKTKNDQSITWIKSKPARIEEDAHGNPVVIGENTLTGERYAMPFDLVVLATGMEPSSAQAAKVPCKEVTYDEYGFVTGGVLAAGCAAAPTDVALSVQSATAMAMKAIHKTEGRG